MRRVSTCAGAHLQKAKTCAFQVLAAASVCQTVKVRGGCWPDALSAAAHAFQTACVRAQTCSGDQTAGETWR
jgi:hypothetical protein